MDENQPTFTRQEALQKTEGGGGSKLLWLVIPIIILALIGGGVFYFRSRQESQEIPILTPTPTPTLAPTSTPTPEVTLTPTPTPKLTPTPTKKPTPTPQRVATTAADLKRQAISVQVLNGSGVAGLAQKAADYLGGFFYTISNVGNAENYNYEKTAIEAKTEANLSLLKADLETQYEIGTASATLPTTSPYDAVIIVGKK